MKWQRDMRRSLDRVEGLVAVNAVCIECIFGSRQRGTVHFTTRHC